MNLETIVKVLIGLAALAFVLAVIGSAVFSGRILGTSPEAFSRACTNLALLAIALSVAGRSRTNGGS